MTLVPVQSQSIGGLEVAFASLRDAHVQALCVLDNAVYLEARQAMNRLAARARIPAIYPYKEHVREGGLMSYSADTAELFRRSAW
jgi:putative ABC transport system substrate-binding protein